ncbi:DUF2530 domain-containing protein [Rhodococcoides yunnanense]|uniref:DUF2530 domain-containing protein n=1 Tax=Rhodococcoides yunnanense TaxID=278209 RepID=UPI00353052B6
MLSPRMTNPTPVIAAGIGLWIAATVVVLLAGDRWAYALHTCWAGIGVGTAGFVVFLVQRAASRRGDKTAQRGLD